MSQDYSNNVDEFRMQIAVWHAMKLKRRNELLLQGKFYPEGLPKYEIWSIWDEVAKLETVEQINKYVKSNNIQTEFNQKLKELTDGNN